jgi:hypothetical protein
MLSLTLVKIVMKMKKKLFSAVILVTLLASVLPSLPVMASPDSGLVGCWHFDGGLGSKAVDSSGNSNHGTLSGGKFGNSLFFNDGNDYVEVSDDASIAPPSITVEAWVKGTAPIGPYKYIISKFYTLKDGSWSSYAFYTGGSGGLQFYIGGEASYRISADAGTSIWDSKWHHIVGTYDDVTDILQFYVDGSFISNSVGGSASAIAYDTGKLFFGTYRPSWGYGSFTGYIDEVRISNLVRYSAPFTAPDSAFSVDANTMGLWHFDESFGSTAYDSSTYSNNGAISGAKWAGPVWTTDAMYGGWALSFDGVNDYVRVPDSPSLDLTTKITVDAWVKFDASSTGKDSVIARKWNAYSLQKFVDDKLEGWVKIGGTWYGVRGVSGGTTLTSGVWYHLAFTYDGTNVKTYVNGILDRTGAVMGDIDATSQDVSIGTDLEGYSAYAACIIDEVTIWNAVLPFHLNFLDASAALVQVGTDASLEVQVTGDNDNPVEGISVTFSNIAFTFTPNPSPTSTDGVATTLAKTSTAGVYTITASATTPFGLLSDTWTLVVYDPSGGFVTGGGWITSPVGAYTADPKLGGKATFGFVSKYQKGAKVPTGNTEFQFHAAGMNFKSTSYEWLVVAGSKAQYKGVGTINGVGEYSFMLDAGMGANLLVLSDSRSGTLQVLSMTMALNK